VTVKRTTPNAPLLRVRIDPDMGALISELADKAHIKPATVVQLLLSFSLARSQEITQWLNTESAPVSLPPETV